MTSMTRGIIVTIMVAAFVFATKGARSRLWHSTAT